MILAKSLLAIQGSIAQSPELYDRVVMIRSRQPPTPVAHVQKRSRVECARIARSTHFLPKTTQPNSPNRVGGSSFPETFSAPRALRSRNNLLARKLLHGSDVSRRIIR